MKKMLLIAVHEFRRTAMTRGFWVQLLMVPIIFGFAAAVPTFTASQNANTYYVLIDQTGAMAQPLADMLDQVVLRQTRPLQPVAGQLPGPIAGGAFRLPVPLGIDINQEPAEIGAALRPFLSGDQRIDTPGGPRRLAAAIVIPRDYATSPDTAAQVWSTNAINTDLVGQLRAALSRLKRVQALTERGIDPQEVARVEAIVAPVIAMNPAKADDQRVSGMDRLAQVVPLGFGILLFVSVFTVGARLLTGIIEERSNKLVETLLSSVTPGQLMIGKLVGIGMVGIAVVVAWVASAVVLINLAPGGAGALASMAGLIGWKLLIAFVAYFILAYTMYAALFLAVGSMSESMQDAQSYMAPLMFVSMLPMLLLVPISTAPHGTLAVVMSWIPFYTPFLMLVRMSANPPLWEIIGTSIVLVAFAALLLWLLARLFRVSILAAGAPMRPGQIWRVLTGRAG